MIQEGNGLRTVPLKSMRKIPSALTREIQNAIKRFPNSKGEVNFKYKGEIYIIGIVFVIGGGQKYTLKQNDKAVWLDGLDVESIKTGLIGLTMAD